MEKFIIAHGTALRISDTANRAPDATPRPSGATTRAAAGTPHASDDAPLASEVAEQALGVVSHTSKGVERVPEDAADGHRTVVLLHGYLENLNVWDTLTGLLQKSVRVIAVDLPGHGISQVRGEVHTMEFLADVVYEALVQSGVVRCTVIGHSMGGYVALALAARHPEMLDGVVLLSSTPNADSPEKRDHREREIAIVEAGRKELLSATLPAKGFAPDNRRRMADEIEDFAELVTLTEDEGITALLRGMMARPDMNDALRALPMSQLFIFGRHDEYLPAVVAEEVLARHPRAAVRWLEASGHNGHIEQPREVAEAILEFMNVNANKNK